MIGLHTSCTVIPPYSFTVTSDIKEFPVVYTHMDQGRDFRHRQRKMEGSSNHDNKGERGHEKGSFHRRDHKRLDICR